MAKSHTAAHAIVNGLALATHQQVGKGCTSYIPVAIQPEQSTKLTRTHTAQATKNALYVSP